MIELDDYERRFIDKIMETSPDSKPIIVDILRLLESCKRKDLSRLKSAIQDVEIKKLVEFMDRSKIYQQFMEFWDRHMFKTIDKFTFNERNFVEIFLPIFLQEIEGPLKRQLLLVNFLLDLDKGSDVSWPKFTRKMKRGRKLPKFIIEIVEEGFELAEHYPEIRSIFSGLKADENIVFINVIRRSIAHSDYKLEFKNDKLMVNFHDQEHNYKFTFEETCRIVTMTFDLILVLHVALHLGIRRVNKLEKLQT